MHDDARVKRQYFGSHAACLWRGYNGGAQILRVYSDSPEVCLPEEICGEKLTSVGAYCFSDKDVFDGLPRGERGFEKSYFRRVCGDFAEKIILPDTVERIGDCAFYNCVNLSQIELGAAAREIGGDVFMNCAGLERIVLRCAADAPNGLKHILGRYAGNLEAVFFVDGKIDAVLFYPEYVDSYDEIAPAHVFGRSIAGSGFRARQCFSGDTVDFAQYDASFDKASAVEETGTLCRTALGRLMYPKSLDANGRLRYEKYLKKNQKDAINMLVSAKDLDGLHFMCAGGLASAEAMDMAAAVAAGDGWSVGAAAVLRWRHEFAGGRGRRYEFD